MWDAYQTDGLLILTVPFLKHNRKTLTSIEEQKVYNYAYQLQLHTEGNDLQFLKTVER
jgi:hypothetical protein